MGFAYWLVYQSHFSTEHSAAQLPQLQLHRALVQRQPENYSSRFRLSCSLGCFGLRLVLTLRQQCRGISLRRVRGRGCNHNAHENKCLIAAVSASRDDDGPKIKSLALDEEDVQAFVAKFGAAQKMTARQIEVAYDAKYIPKPQGPDFGVPEVVTAGLKYSEWRSCCAAADAAGWLAVHAAAAGTRSTCTCNQRRNSTCGWHRPASSAALQPLVQFYSRDV